MKKIEQNLKISLFNFDQKLMQIPKLSLFFFYH